MCVGLVCHEEQPRVPERVDSVKPPEKQHRSVAQGCLRVVAQVFTEGEVCARFASRS